MNVGYSRKSSEGGPFNLSLGFWTHEKILASGRIEPRYI